MRSFLGGYIFGGFWTTRREIGVKRTTNTHVLGKGRPGEKVGVERTTRTEYTLILIRNYSVLVVHMVSYPVLVVPTSHLVVLFTQIHLTWSYFYPFGRLSGQRFSIGPVYTQFYRSEKAK